MQRGTSKFVLAISLAIGGFAAEVSAQLPPPPPPPATLWSFLGIPQGYRRMRDGLSNRNGNRPNAERQPPLKAIADPANLKSPNPAIKKAAEIKMEEDLAQQKIKAVKYLASIGCGCYNRDGSITDALLQAMDDCTESVRLASVQAISLAAAGEMCANCKQRSCCSEELSNKLYEIAYERDENGCYLEPSERVRLAAAEALRICCPGGGEDIIFEAAPPVMPPPGGVEQPGVLPEGGVERPGADLPPVLPGPTPAVPPGGVQPGPTIPPGALPTDPPPPAPPPAPITPIPAPVLPPVPPPVPPVAPAAEATPVPRSSRRTAMLSIPTSLEPAKKSEAPAALPLGVEPKTPHWSPAMAKASVYFLPTGGKTVPIAGHPAAELASVSGENAPGEEPAGVPATIASLTRLPPVEPPAMEAPPLPEAGTPARQVSSRRTKSGSAPRADQSSERPAKQPKAKSLLRSGGERQIPGRQFGVGTVTSVRFKDGLAFLEFGGDSSVPAGSIIRAYHEFALTGKTPVCDLEVIDGQPGQTIAIARSGSEITSLTVGDHAIVLQ